MIFLKKELEYNFEESPKIKSNKLQNNQKSKELNLKLSFKKIIQGQQGLKIKILMSSKFRKKFKKQQIISNRKPKEKVSYNKNLKK